MHLCVKLAAKRIRLMVECKSIRLSVECKLMSHVKSNLRLSFVANLGLAQQREVSLTGKLRTIGLVV